MKQLIPISTVRSLALVMALLSAVAPPAGATSQSVDNTSVDQMAVNGGADTANPGTTCIHLAVTPVAACTSGWIAIQNNNKQLLASALQAKATGARVWVYYEDASASQHCPGLALTPCTVISIMVK